MYHGILDDRQKVLCSVHDHQTKHYFDNNWHIQQPCNLNQNFGHHLDNEYDLGSHIDKVFANIIKTTRGLITLILIVVRFS